MTTTSKRRWGERKSGMVREVMAWTWRNRVRRSSRTGVTVVVKPVGTQEGERTSQREGKRSVSCVLGPCSHTHVCVYTRRPGSSRVLSNPFWTVSSVKVLVQRLTMLLSVWRVEGSDWVGDRGRRPKPFTFHDCRCGREVVNSSELGTVPQTDSARSVGTTDPWWTFFVSLLSS